MTSPVAIIGTGVIGASWAACFLAHGHDVVASDPAPGAEDALRRAVEADWPVLEQLGLAPGASPDRLRFVAAAAEAVSGAGFVQENGPERLDLKLDLFRALDDAAPEDTVIASSSSTLMPSEFSAGCTRHRERVLVGHPFNPPHLIPLVEVVGGSHASAAAVEAAMAFYRACGKRPIRIRKEMRGHVANRLQAALWQEAFHLVREGVVDVADVDAAISHGPGLRWALLGPFLNLHLSGGAGGMAHNLRHLGPPTEAMWRDLGTVSLDPVLNELIVAGVADELRGRDLPEMVRQRDAALAGLLRAKAAAEALP